MDGEIQFALYNMPDDSGNVQVVIKDETIWCTQKAMAQLFAVGVPAISKHLKNIFEEGELVADSVISKMETTAADNKIYETSFSSFLRASTNFWLSVAIIFCQTKGRSLRNRHGRKPRRNTPSSTRRRR